MLIIDSQTFKAYINGVLVRIKKGGDDNLGCNHPTQTALAFEDADAQFPGLPPETTKVEIIWLPNEIWTRSNRCSSSRATAISLIWQYEIPAEKGSGTPPIPIKSPTPDGAEGADLIKPKAAKAKKNSKS